MMNELSWQPSASIECFTSARLIIWQQFVNFLLNVHYLEVETPVMARYGVTDVYLSNIKATFRG